MCSPASSPARSARLESPAAGRWDIEKSASRADQEVQHQADHNLHGYLRFELRCMCANAHPAVPTPQTASGSQMEPFTMRPPATAPTSIATIAARRRCLRGLFPPVTTESAATLVIVKASTVVVRSGSQITRHPEVGGQKSACGSFLFSGARCPVRIVSNYLAQTWRQRTPSKAPLQNRDRANYFRSRGQYATTLFPHFEEVGPLHMQLQVPSVLIALGGCAL